MRAQWRQVAEQVQSCRGESERGELAPVARRSGLRDETQEGVMASGQGARPAEAGSEGGGSRPRASQLPVGPAASLSQWPLSRDSPNAASCAHTVTRVSHTD